MTVQPLINENRREAFAGRFLDALNEAAVVLMASIGHRTGLFDVMAALPPATSDEIADAAGLDERYVREWLGAMTTGRVVEYDPATATFVLPREHASLLTRAAGADNLGVQAQYVGLLGGVENRIVECFRNGGGVPYSEFGRFQEVMADESAVTVVGALEDSILPLVPGLPDRLEDGIDVLDIGCGQGRALNVLATRFPNSRFTGWDISIEGIEKARAEAAANGSANIRFEIRDIATAGPSDRFDLVTAFDVIHDQAKPARVLENVHAALRPGGTFLMQDIGASSHVEENVDHPIGPFLYTISCMHCMTVSLSAGGEGLGTVWGRQRALAMLAEAGFESVRVETLPHDFINEYFVTGKE